jgi:hypothetical protein
MKKILMVIICICLMVGMAYADGNLTTYGNMSASYSQNAMNFQEYSWGNTIGQSVAGGVNYNRSCNGGYDFGLLNKTTNTNTNFVGNNTGTTMSGNVNMEMKGSAATCGIGVQSTLTQSQSVNQTQAVPYNIGGFGVQSYTGKQANIIDK